MSAALLSATAASQKATTPTTTTTPFPLLALPLEIRLLIYQHALTHPSLPTLRRLSTQAHCSDYVLPALPVSPALLLTCRLINSEATPVLYGANTFAAHPSLLTSLPYLVRPSAPIRDPAVARRIRRWWVHVRLDTDPAWEAAEVCAAFDGCEELEVEVFQAQFASCGYAVLRRFEGVRGVRTARVCGSVEEGFARWLEGVMMSGVGERVEGHDEFGEG
ncbi:hypothetical protein EV356DRAFT_563533 [Viridothelium virens]|uniref:F-box domain-containing protein n=1 Tax=Viridothelium virens TaxID=1048519 RepID=A0A6A6HMS0_VIRVR|nr:hypothetical protein EV356DRAFT_563533 [Viridothelium virens]